MKKSGKKNNPVKLRIIERFNWLDINIASIISSFSPNWRIEFEIFKLENTFSL